MTYEIRPTTYTVAPVGEPIFSAEATHVRIQDDAGGEFIEIEQEPGNGKQVVRFNKDEWPVLVDTVARLLMVIR